MDKKSVNNLVLTRRRWVQAMNLNEAMLLGL